jgi:TolB-like protein/DNA-binding winged helix-turn-helix (wHTH) protein/tetratricopeptide (TPR) repeat protein
MTPETHQPGERIAFGSFEVDMSSGELFKNGRRIRLARQPADLLALLVRRRGALVSREELRAALWPEDTFVDFDHGLNNCIRCIREALGDSANSSRFVETLPKKGYRFIPEIRALILPQGALAPPLAPMAKELAGPTTQAVPQTSSQETPPQSGHSLVVESESDGPHLNVAAGALAAPPRLTSRKPALLALIGMTLLALLCAAGLFVGLNFHGWREEIFGLRADRQVRSIAVLPLVNLSADSDQEYFSDGMTDELITCIAKASPLQVISRTSVMRYKGTKKSLNDIARELGVEGIVEGSVLRSSSRVRVTIQLVDARSDKHLWAETYERDMQDIFALQSDIAEAVSTQIASTLGLQANSNLKRRPVPPEAYEAYLKGRYYLNKRKPDDLKKSQICFQEAIEKDPTYASAYAGLADSYQVLGSWEGGILPPQEAFPKAIAAYKKALEIDSTLADAHSSLGYAQLYYHWDWAGAEKEFKRAIELNPNSETAHHWYSHYLLSMGRTEESLSESKRGIQLAPFDPLLNVHLVWHYTFSRQYSLSVQQSHTVLTMDLPPYGAYLFGGWALEQQGRYREAIDWFRKACASSGEISHATAALGHAYGVSGDVTAANRVLAQLKQLSKHRYVPAYDIAMVYLGLGEKKQAYDWLENGFRERSAWMVYLNMDPRLNGLRSDPKFIELVRRVGLPQSR